MFFVHLDNNCNIKNELIFLDIFQKCKLLLNVVPGEYLGIFLPYINEKLTKKWTVLQKIVNLFNFQYVEDKLKEKGLDNPLVKVWAAANLSYF